MKHHAPFMYSSPVGVMFRGCNHCLQTWQLVQDKDSFRWGWVPLEERDEEGKPERMRHNPNECQGDVTQVERKSDFVASKSKPAGGNNFCHCAQCRGRKLHYDGATRCFCDDCDGKRRHN